MATLVVEYLTYRCAECMQPIVFEPNADLLLLGKAIGSCQHLDCERKGLRIRVQLHTIEAEYLHDA